MDWIATAPVFLVWCGDMRAGQRLCAMHDMPTPTTTLDTFLNTRGRLLAGPWLSS